MRLPLPEVLAESREDGTVELKLRLSPSLECFQGHFPGFPILPGVVQIDWAVRFAARCFPRPGRFLEARNLRFLSIMGPDAEPTLRLSQQAGALQFSYSSGGKKCSSGTLLFEAP